MAHFAEIDSNNIVIRVVVVSNDVLLDENNVEQESLGRSFCESLFGGGTWIQTSYNNNFRQIYAHIGGEYDPVLDKFKPRQPYASWTFNNTSWEWEPPTPIPTTGGPYMWDEETLSWIENQP